MKQHRPLGRWICSLQRTIVSFFNVCISDYNLWRTLDLDSPWTPINNNVLVLFWHASRWRGMRITAIASTTWRNECAWTTQISATCAVKFKSGGSFSSGGVFELQDEHRFGLAENITCEILVYGLNRRRKLVKFLSFRRRCVYPGLFSLCIKINCLENKTSNTILNLISLYIWFLHRFPHERILKPPSLITFWNKSEVSLETSHLSGHVTFNHNFQNGGSQQRFRSFQKHWGKFSYGRDIVHLQQAVFPDIPRCYCVFSGVLFCFK